MVQQKIFIDSDQGRIYRAVPDLVRHHGSVG